MHVVCAMFGRKLGGIEQSLLDYCEALCSQGHMVTAFIFPGAAIEPKLRQLASRMRINVETLRNFGQRDLLAPYRLRRRLKEIRPDLAITFGNRSVSLLKIAAKNLVPVAATTPNYSIKRLIGLDAIYHTTQDLADHIVKNGQAKETLYYIPNMIKIPEGHTAGFQPFKSPPVIGTMARFVKKKGLVEFIRALAELEKRNPDFKAVIGGDGEEKNTIVQLLEETGLKNKVTLLGWVEDKEKFFDSIDIFCLPSLSEPFGIILLEAFLHAKPVVTTASEGPREIATHNKNALVVPIGGIKEMAETIKQFLDNPRLAEDLALTGMKTVKETYAMDVVAKKINNAVEETVAAYTSKRR